MNLKYPKNTIIDVDKCHDIKIGHANLYSTHDLLIRIIAKLFDRSLDEMESKGSHDKEYDNKRKFIDRFEKVMSCVRFEVIDTKEIFKENRDNLDILMGIKESINIEVEFKKLLDKYLDVMDIKHIKVEIEYFAEYTEKKEIKEIDKIDFDKLPKIIQNTFEEC